MNRIRRLALLTLLSPVLQAAGQSLDIQQHRFTPDVRVLTAPDYLPRDILRTFERTGTPLPEPVAVGTLDGVTYLYRSNGVALFATTQAQDWQKMSRSNSWAIECTKDAMEDFVTCQLTREDVTLALRDSSYVALVVGRNHYPGSTVALRVDQDRPFQSAAPGFGQPSPKDIVERMRAGRSLTTRYQEWPYQANVDRTVDLYGFNEALQFLHWAITRFK